MIKITAWLRRLKLSVHCPAHEPISRFVSPVLFRMDRRGVHAAKKDTVAVADKGLDDML